MYWSILKQTRLCRVEAYLKLFFLKKCAKSGVCSTRVADIGQMQGYWWLHLCATWWKCVALQDALWHLGYLVKCSELRPMSETKTYHTTASLKSPTKRGFNGNNLDLCTNDLMFWRAARRTNVGQGCPIYRSPSTGRSQRGLTSGSWEMLLA